MLKSIIDLIILCVKLIILIFGIDSCPL